MTTNCTITLPWDYQVRVRGSAYLWGSAGLGVDLTFDRPLVLYVRNPVFGETITLGTERANGTRTVLGTLSPGETVAIPMQTIRGVFAQCALEFTVRCAIKAP